MFRLGNCGGGCPGHGDLGRWGMRILAQSWIYVLAPWCGGLAVRFRGRRFLELGSRENLPVVGLGLRHLEYADLILDVDLWTGLTLIRELWW